MNSGTFTPGIEKDRAGIYFRFISAAQNLLGNSARGRVAVPVSL